MGSSGTGTFGNYRPGNGSGENEKQKCADIIKINLEDIEFSEYFKNQNNVPESEQEVYPEFNNSRIVIKLKTSNEIIGNLPTKYNYILDCLNNNIMYLGKVITSGSTPIYFIVVDLYVIK